MAKQRQRATQEQLADRRIFDAAMNQLLDGKQMITRLTAEMIMKLNGFNIRRAAYYIQKRRKTLLREAADYWLSQFRQLGGLPTKCIA